MVRYIAAFLLILFVWASVDTLQVVGASGKNPYSGFNISGINYGAQQWERDHGGKKSGGSKSYGRYRRGR